MVWKTDDVRLAYEAKLESDLASWGDGYAVQCGVAEFVKLRNDRELIDKWAYAGNPPHSCDRMAGWDAVEAVFGVPAWATAESGKVRELLMPYVNRVVNDAFGAGPYYYDKAVYDKGEADRARELAAYEAEAARQSQELGPTDEDFNAVAARVEAHQARKRAERDAKRAEQEAS